MGSHNATIACATLCHTEAACWGLSTPCCQQGLLPFGPWLCSGAGQHAAG